MIPGFIELHKGDGTPVWVGLHAVSAIEDATEEMRETFNVRARIYLHGLDALFVQEWPRKVMRMLARPTISSGIDTDPKDAA